MAIKINTAYGERLTSGMLNEKISNLVGGNEKLSGFDVSIASPTSVTIKPGKAIINGCAIEETSDTNTVVIDPRILSNDSIAYVVIDYSHENKRVVFSCVTQLTSSMVKLATLFIKSGVISELTNHNPLQTLNSIVSEAAEIEAQRVRDSIPSGFVELGGLDYDFMLNNENQVKLKTKSIAYVNGYRVEIPAGTIIDIGKSPEKSTREDLLFLEAWKDTDFSKNGKLKYRIRHVSNVDFNRYHMDGFSAGTNGRNRQVTAQGGSDKPFTPTFDTDATGSFNRSDLLHLNDTGLFVTSQNAKLFKTFDGYVYAIPMFRLYRKPSCGKSIPFEYSKINPKVNYNKFTKLMKEDKVERVVTENIQGRSLVNLINSVIGDNLLNDSGSYWGKSFTYVVNLKPNTLYTLIIDFELLDTSYAKLDSIILGNSASISNLQNNYRLWGIPTGNNVIQFTTPSDYEPGNFRFVIEKSNSPNKPTLRLNNCMIVEGDLSNKEIPEFFTGLKSLGEDDGNLITIKNGILNDDTYDINDGNQKLNTFPSVTHVLSENTIIPTVEAVVDKGGDTTPLEKLGSKLETEGHEVIEFTKIKGRTLQNLSKTKNGTLTYSPVPSSDLYISLAHSLKTNTDYTLIFDITTNTLDASFKLALQSGDNVIWKNLTTQGKLGEFRYVFNADKPISIIRVYTDDSNSGKVVLDNIRLVEGNYLDFSYENLPFVEGIKSAGETEGNIITLHSTGKNIYNGISENTFTTTVDSWYFLDGKLGAYGDMSSKTDTIFTLPKGQYKFNYEGSFIQLCTADESQCWGRNTLIDLKTDTKLVFRLKNGVGTVSFNNLYIEAGDILTGYEPCVEYTQNIYLKEPLRSLPNGVCDELVGNKVIRRVGKVILDGSTAMRVDTALNQSNTIAFVITNPGLRNKDNGSLLSSLLPPVDGDTYWSKDIECIMSANELYFKFRVLKTKLDSLDNGGMQKWLKSNPITVYYELLNPIDEYLENIYEKESIKTYQLDAPLRSLPNGVKDEIKNGVLIRRCGAYTFTGNEGMKVSSVGWENATMVTTFEGGLGYPTNCLYSSNSSNKLLCNTFNWNDFNTQFASAQSGSTGIRGITTHEHGKFVLSINKSELSSQDWDGMSAWLKNNPTTVIYQLATPTETILTEAKPQTANFSLQRQFEEGNYLRELPNGVKDTIENGKVIRRVGKVVLNGSETWQFDQGNMLKDTLMFSSPLVCSSTSNYVLSNKFDSDNTLDNGWETDTETICVVLGSRLRIRILKSKLATQDARGLTTWLQQNPTTVLYELATPVEETLSTDNYVPYPCHDFNTYCGSMYVGEGRNHVINDNKMPGENTIIVETDFREIEGKAKVEDCNFKKNDEGYDTMCLLPTNKNLFDGIWEKGMINTDGSISGIQSTTRKYSKNFIRVIPGKTYVFSANLGEDRINLKGYDLNKKLVHNFSYSAKHTIPKGCYFVRFYNGHDSSVNLDNIKAQFELGETATSYVEGINTFRSFENTESNDIDDLRHQVSLTGFNYIKILDESFDKLLRGEL